MRHVYWHSCLISDKGKDCMVAVKVFWDRDLLVSNYNSEDGLEMAIHR